MPWCCWPVPDPTLDLPRAWGGVAGSGRLRAEPEDFRVEEVLGFKPSGEGEHLLLRVRKRNLNTVEVARRIARGLGVRSREVSWAGLKDRNAVTVQTFSVHLPGRADPDLSVLEDDRLAVLSAARHHRKLRRGALRGNRFRIRVRGFRGDTGLLAERLQRIGEAGAPNWFGSQRFGRDGGNLDRALALFRGELRRVPREQRAIWLSAARAFLFNRVLAERVDRGDWNRVLPGEVLQPEGSSAQFRAGEDDTLERRLAVGEVHPTGPLWGRVGRCLLPEGEAGALESAALAEMAEWCVGLERAGLEMDRRALRVMVKELEWSREGDDLVVAFFLGKGSYATAVLREIL